jgi:hypothetical protein
LNDIYYNILKNLLEMRNNRNTVGDQFKPTQTRNLANSVDRKTMTNPQNHQTQSRQYTQQQLN